MIDEPFGPDDHWVNNPLISPASKVDEFDKAIAHAKAEERQHLIEIIKTLWHPEEECDWGCENYGCGNGYYDALIKRLEGENK